MLDGQYGGIREVHDKILFASFMQCDLGIFDENEKRVEPALNPFLTKVLPVAPVWRVTDVLGTHLFNMARPEG